ncbi:ALTO [Sheep polyomavirus 1]|uniref:ALTO n=1 Tax=Sheep polyomavirus 1 TaxID=1634381 RepID=UPI00061DD78C|nr:ALTO [Sheep polyomavirus 1]AKC98334.1 ALTO [Sheep polyomavirus 1]
MLNSVSYRYHLMVPRSGRAGGRHSMLISSAMKRWRRNPLPNSHGEKKTHRAPSLHRPRIRHKGTLRTCLLKFKRCSVKLFSAIKL